MVDTKRWPAWCNGPDGETAIINSPEELPKGWKHPRLSPLDHDSDGKLGGSVKRGRPAKPDESFDL